MAQQTAWDWHPLPQACAARIKLRQHRRRGVEPFCQFFGHALIAQPGHLRLVFHPIGLGGELRLAPVFGDGHDAGGGDAVPLRQGFAGGGVKLSGDRQIARFLKTLQRIDQRLAGLAVDDTGAETQPAELDLRLHQRAVFVVGKATSSGLPRRRIARGHGVGALFPGSFARGIWFIARRVRFVIAGGQDQGKRQGSGKEGRSHQVSLGGGWPAPPWLRSAVDRACGRK